jgi:hypothetical protein
MADPHWVAWHSPYDNPTSRLSRRLAAVQDSLRLALDGMAPGPIRIISVCAGQGRDLAGVLADHPRRDDVTGVAVELEPGNVAFARELLATAGVTGIDVLELDASMTDAYVDAVPADIALVCGVFGNISDGDITHTIEMLPRLCADRATVIWTRHRGPPDLTPTIREWFADRGWDEDPFVAPADTNFGVGTNRMASAPLPWRPGIRLFNFTGDGGGVPA